MTIVAAVEPHEVTILETIKHLGLELGGHHSTMAQSCAAAGPSTKPRGLVVAIEQLDLPATAVERVGNAENDHSFSSGAALPPPLANHLPSIQDSAGFVTQGTADDGAAKLITMLPNDKLEGLH